MMMSQMKEISSTTFYRDEKLNNGPVSCVFGNLATSKAIMVLTTRQNYKREIDASYITPHSTQSNVRRQDDKV